jgi:phosphate transport system permease protein
LTTTTPPISPAQAAARADRIFRITLWTAVTIFAVTVVGLFVQLVHGSWQSIVTFGFGFLVSSSWNPVTGQFGALPMIYGTVVSSFIAIAIAAVIGIGAATYLAEFAPRQIADPLAALIELLAAVPSVVYGLWGLFVLVPIFRQFIDPFLQTYFGYLPIFSGPIYGVGLLTAGLVLAIMILPTVSAISRDVIRAVRRDQREAGMALGSTKWETTWRIVLPAARTGIFGACVLALGRALGETIAATMVIGNKPVIAASLFAPSYTLSSVIANEFTEATSDVYISSLIELGLLLFVLSFIVNGFARLLVNSVFARNEGR